MDVQKKRKLMETEPYLCLSSGFLTLRNKLTLAVGIPGGTWAVEKSLPSFLSRGGRHEETHCLASALARGTESHM